MTDKIHFHLFESRFSLDYPHLFDGGRGGVRLKYNGASAVIL